MAGELLTRARTLGYGDQDIVALFDVLADLPERARAAAA
jgi:hypothetical protein